jgi:hypothetical protein
MKLLYVSFFCVMSVFSMDLEKKQICLINHHENIKTMDITETIPLINPNQIVLEVTQGSDLEDDKEDKPTTDCCACNKTKAAVFISAITTSSVAVMALITGITTIVVAIINHK